MFTLEYYEEILCLTTNEFILFNKYEELQYFLKLNNNALTDDNFKEIGDLLMKSNNYDKAIFYYEKAIKISEKNNINNNIYLFLEILYNLFFAYLNYGYFSKVLYYCDYALRIIKNNINNNDKNIKDIKSKIFYIKIKGYIALRKYKKGFEFYKEYKDDNDIIKINELNNNNIKQMIDDIILKKENENGIFNFKEMQLEEQKNFYLNYGDYINPKIEINFDKEKGLNIICKKNNCIKRGELVIAEKALISKRLEDNIDKKKIIGLNMSNNYNKKELPYQNLELTNELMEKIKKYKKDYEIFFILYDEENKKENIEERKKRYLNGEEKRIGFEKVKKIIDCCKYSASRSFLFENKIGFGLWGYVSILNHSCNPNITYFSIGDFMLCFAIRDIAEGEELNTLYIPNSLCYSLRQAKFMNNWNFCCSCELCTYDKNNINKVKKQYYENSLKDFYDIGDNKIIHKNINQKFILFEKFIVDNKKELNSFEIANGYLQLIYHYGILDNYNKCKEISDKLFAYLEKYNYYSFEIENLNILFYFFGYKDKNIFNNLIKKFEHIFEKYNFLNKEDFATLIKVTLNVNNFKYDNL